jgi:phosphate starvation-inducible membrane PsiE
MRSFLLFGYCMEHGILLLSLRRKKTTRFLFQTYLSNSEARDTDVIENVLLLFLFILIEIPHFAP